MSNKYYFSFIDDAIWILRDLTRNRPESLFDNPFFKILKNAHDSYGLKTQINLFYRTDYSYGMDEFTLAQVTDAYKEEFEGASDWLKFGFHALQEFPDYPHVNVSYEDMHKLFNMIKDEVIRFAGEDSFSYAVVPHWVPVSYDGCRALYDCGAKLVAVTVGKRMPYNPAEDTLPYGHTARLLQNRKEDTMLFTRQTKDVAISNSICAYNHFEDAELEDNDKVLGYVTDKKTGLNFKKLDDNFDLNLFTAAELKEELKRRSGDELICIGNHEQYFFKDYFAYQEEYEEKIYIMAKTMMDGGRECIFMEDLLALS